MSWIDLLKIFLIASIAVGLMAPLLVRLCFRAGLLDMPGRHKRHHFPTPNLGGVAIFVGFWTAILIAYSIYPILSLELGQSFYFVMAGALIIFLVGLVDDVSDLSALSKLMFQTIVGFLLYFGGLRITVLFIPLYGPTELGYLSLPVTLLWLVGLTNCINLIDGLDGLAAGVSSIASLALLFVGIYLNMASVMAFAAAIIGVCLVFLYFNHYPAKLFMGDSGALSLGYLFAVITILFPIKSYATAAIFIPLVALGVPIIETVVSFMRRTISGQPFYRADNRHLFHYLVNTGLSKKQVVWLFYILSGIFAIFSGAMFIFNRRMVFTILLVFMVVIFAVLVKFRVGLFVDKDNEEK